MSAPGTGPDTIERIARDRWVFASWLTLLIVGAYFGFILLIAFNKELMGTLVSRGMSLGILGGSLLIVGSWILTYVYARWANDRYDGRLSSLGEGRSR